MFVKIRIGKYTSVSTKMFQEVSPSETFWVKS